MGACSSQPAAAQQKAPVSKQAETEKMAAEAPAPKQQRVDPSADVDAAKANLLPPSLALLPGILRLGGGCSVSGLGATLKALGSSRPIVVTDAFLQKQGSVEKLLSEVKGDASFDIAVYDETLPDPTVDVVRQAVAACRAHKADLVIGFGGGSPMDTAKAVAVCAGVDGGENKLAEWKVPNAPPKGLPMVAVPTTAGTGSEVTRVTIITDHRKDPEGNTVTEKMLLLAPTLQPAAALVDYEWTITKPFRLTADTGIDALCHAVEGYTSRKANDFSDGVALRAVNIISRNLRAACFTPKDRVAREKMAYGAMLGGMAFSNSSVHLIHGMSRPIGAHFHIPHGLSNAMLLPIVTRFALEAPTNGDATWGGDYARSVQRYADVARAMDAPQEALVTTRKACDWLIKYLSELNKELKVPTPQMFVGEKRGEAEAAKQWTTLKALMAEQALASGSPNNCPRIASKDRITEMYTFIWDNTS